MKESLEHKEWRGNTGGTPWMQQLLVLWLKYTPLAIPYFCMAWMIPFYMALNHKGYLAIYRYFRQRQGYGKLKAFCHVYLNHFRFGQVIIDRFAMFAGRRFKLEVDGQELFDELDCHEEGFIILSTHVGNYELAGYSLTPKRKSFNVLVFAEETEQMMKGRSKMFGGRRINMIPMSQDMSHVFAINSALSEGNIVSIPGDRVFGSPRHLNVEFMGKTARFPMGPLSIAAQRELDVLAVFVTKKGVHSYYVKVAKLNVPKDTNRKDRPRLLAEAYAREIEAILAKYPDQWFNFYDYWEG